MEIGVEHCADADSAVQKLTRQRFEAVIVDCSSPEVARKVLNGIRSAPANRRAITVAVQDAPPPGSETNLKCAFDMGSHFVLFKPISLERTRASFHAVRALMKHERRRNARIPIELSVEFTVPGTSPLLRATTSDLSENGMAIKTKVRKLPPSFEVRFMLPGTAVHVDCHAAVAWEGGDLLGIRFCDMVPEMRDQLKQWIGRQLFGAEGEELPVGCQLTDLSPSACYLQTESPFPLRTRLQLTMKVGEFSVHTDGIVRLMHPGNGMGVELTKNTSLQRARVEDFIRTLVNTADAVPDIEVQPDAIDNSADAFLFWQFPDDRMDPLLSLFRSRTELSPDLFQMELRKQRGVLVETATAVG
jgi:hypothetical protein